MTEPKKNKLITAFALAVLLGTIALFTAPGEICASVRPGAKLTEGNLTLEARNASFAEILETLARTAGVDIFIGRGFQMPAQKLNFRFDGVPLEEAIRRILRGYNYAAIYEKEGNDFRVAALRIYPAGQMSGEVVPLFTGNRTAIYEEKTRRGETVKVLVDTGGNIVTQGQLGSSGHLIPSQSFLAESARGQADSIQTPWFALQAQLESQEAAKFQEIMLLQKRLEAANDPALKQSLAMIYADELAKYHAIKKANFNKIEALKRITQFKELTGN